MGDAERLANVADIVKERCSQAGDEAPAETVVVVSAMSGVTDQLIAGARAWIECTLIRYDAVGDHTVFYGEVLRTAVDESKKPLVLFNRIYYRLGSVKGNYP